MTALCTEAELIVRAKARDHQALADIYQRYSPAIYRYIYYRVHDPELAEDLRAEVFLRMLEKIDSFEDRGWSLSSWLYRIAHDRTIDALRYRGVRKHVPLGEWNGMSESLEYTVSTQLEHEALYQSINRLTDEQRTVIQMRFLQDMSIKEVAQVLGCTEGAVKAMQYRGLRAMQRHLRHTVPFEAVSQC